MTVYNRNALKAYQQAQVNTNNQLSLVTMLYEGAIRFLRLSIIKIENKNFEEAHFLLTRCQDIVTELLCSLDVKSNNPVVKNLLLLYEFIFRNIVQANLKKDINTINQVIVFFENLLEGWSNVAKQKKQPADTNKIGNKTKVTSIYG